MSSSARLSRPPMAQVQTTREDHCVERESHVSCPASQDGAGDHARLVEERPAAVAPLRLPRMAVCDLMTRNVVSVRPELSLESVTALFTESGLEALPVVDAAGVLLGFVSESVVRRAARAHCEAPCTLGQQQTVCDLMSPRALALPESACVTRAAALMAFEGEPRLAVISRTGKVVGVLSAGDVLYWLARADGHVLPRARPR